VRAGGRRAVYRGRSGGLSLFSLYIPFYRPAADETGALPFNNLLKMSRGHCPDTFFHGIIITNFNHLIIFGYPVSFLIYHYIAVCYEFLERWKSIFKKKTPYKILGTGLQRHFSRHPSSLSERNTVDILFMLIYGGETANKSPEAEHGA
jgi:hypothetical protein